MAWGFTEFANLVRNLTEGNWKDVADAISKANDKENQEFSQDIEDNTAILQTKTSGTDPVIPNSLAAFVDDITIQSTDVYVIDDMIGIGTQIPSQKLDVRTPGSQASQVHIAAQDNDAGLYITAIADSSFLITGGASFDGTNYIAQDISATGLITGSGVIQFISDIGLTPGLAYTPTPMLGIAAGDPSPSTPAIVISNGGTFTRLTFPQTGVGAPTFTNRSVGAKILLYPTLSGSASDIAIGVDFNTMWFGHFDTNVTRLFKWYGGTTEIMRLQGDGRLLVRTGTSTSFAAVGGTRFDYFTDANNSGTAETDLYSSTTAANALSSNGDKFTATYQLICTGLALSTQQMKIYFGGTVIYDSGALAIGAVTNNFTFQATIIRVSSSVVRCAVAVSTDFATLFPYSKYTEVTGLTLSNTNILKITGQAAGAAGASSQITAKLGCVSWQPAAV